MTRIRSVDALQHRLESAGLPPAEREFRFHPTRRWRFDLAWPDRKLAIEYNGGIWRLGRHNRAPGYLGDLEKINHAQALGWRVIQYAPGMNADQFVQLIMEIYYADQSASTGDRTEDAGL